jgi:peptidyl-tRNA hydrolase, PTH1 family
MANGIRLIAGLGNPGPDYSRTRHNAGFWFLDALLRAHGGRLSVEKKLNAELGRINIGGQEVWLLKPMAFMNLSGQAVGAAMRYFKFETAELLVAYDELDLPPGTCRLKFDGGHGGHNGMRDIFAHLGNGAFHRLRIGIGHPGHRDQVTPWVLGRPSAEQERAITASLDAAKDIVPDLLRGAFERAMLTLHTPTP